MNLRNYTSGTPVERSISFIERRLVEAGAGHIAKQYSAGLLTGIIFSLSGPQGKMVPIRLPADVEKCEKLFMDAVRRPRKGTAAKVRQQAERTAWKLLSDWVDVQVSMIALQQAEPLEIFLPYMFDAREDRTFYSALKDGQTFKALPFTE